MQKVCKFQREGAQPLILVLMGVALVILECSSIRQFHYVLV